MLKLIITKSNDPKLLELMQRHYSQPKGIVGRRICYSVWYDDIYYGHIVGGSATLNLPGRNEFFSIDKNQLRNIVNNIFFHIEPKPTYPVRNFTTKVVREWRNRVSEDWFNKYGDQVLGFETLVELPRKGNLYRKDKWTLVGQTIGYTCKRVSGVTKEKWILERHGRGVRVWDYENLRPKLVFCKRNG